LSNYFGFGLHIWQYPSQLARYLASLSLNCKEITCYVEIGCRWDGTFILVSEWLQKQGRNVNQLIGVD
jgi:cephalosporin hydroxylase